ncbi:reverse transcriptase domain-containing protein, partial [Tanacetum coccineum]
TLGEEVPPQRLEEPTPDEVLRELCDKNYHQLLSLIAEKMQKEKEQQDKLNAVKARLLYGNETGKNQRNHEESHYSESKTPTARTEPKRRHENRRSRSPTPVASVFKRLKRNRPPSPRPRSRKEGGVFNRLGGKERSASAHSDDRHQSSHEKEIEVQPREHHHRGTSSWETGGYSESEDSEGGHWKSKSRRHMSNTHEDDLSQPWTYEERNPFTPRIRYFNFPRTRMPSHVKTYDGSGDPKDHLKLFQAATKTERWAMPTWCHMFNSTLTGNARVLFDKLPRESIDSYEDLGTAFRENYLQQTKHIKDPVEIHHIKQRDGESTKDFIERFKAEILDVEGVSECMKISGFMHVEETDRRDDQVRQIVAIHQRIKAKRQAKGTKEGGNGQKRQAPSHLDNSTMGEGSKAKGHPKFFSGDNNLFFAPARNELHGYHVTIPTQWNNRQNGHKKDPRRTIHGTRNVKIPGKGRNGNDTKKQSHPDGMCNDLQT